MKTKLGRRAAHIVLGAIGATALIAGGLLLVADTTTVAEREERITSLALAFGIIAGTAWLYPRIQRASEATLFRGTLVVMAVLLAVCAYATLAVAGIVPAAPWSALG